MSIAQAVRNLRRPVILEISQDLSGAAHLVKDTRKPEVLTRGCASSKQLIRKTVR